MQHSREFEALCQAVRPHITEITPDQARAALASGTGAQLIDVREDREWNAERIEGASHLGRGVIERDIVAAVPDKQTELLLYCGGGYRSALAALNLQLMGYRKVRSISGGFKAMKASGWKTLPGA
jgi:rhodanese-related sulfurtransferase